MGEGRPRADAPPVDRSGQSRARVRQRDNLDKFFSHAINRLKGIGCEPTESWEAGTACCRGGRATQQAHLILTCFPSGLARTLSPFTT